jgi:hypothetical protein
MLEVMAQRPTTTVRVYPETRAEISRLAEAEGISAAEVLERLVARSADDELLDEMNAWDAAHAAELGALAREPYPLEADGRP